jgi:hypothetical protein
MPHRPISYGYDKHIRMIAVSTLNRRCLQLTIAATVSAAMTFMLWRNLHHVVVSNRAEEIYSQVLFWLNSPSVLLAIMIGGVHNADRVIICLGAAVQWFVLGYVLSLLLLRPKEPSQSH